MKILLIAMAVLSVNIANAADESICDVQAQADVVRQAYLDNGNMLGSLVAGDADVLITNGNLVTYQIYLFQEYNGEKGCGTGLGYNVTIDMQDCSVVGKITPVN